MDFTISTKFFLLWIMSSCFYLVSISGQEFESEAHDVRVMRNESVTINCKVKNLGSYNVFWLKDGRVLSLNHLILITNSKFSIVGKYNLLIRNIQDEDEGTYQCQISTKQPLDQLTHLMVTVPPTVKMLNKSRPIETTLHDNISLQCVATGRPQPNITWSRQDKLMPNGEQMVYGDVLTLTDLEYNHGGMYKCTASNDVGDDAEDMVRVKVLYPPTIYTEEQVIITGPNEQVSVPCVISAQPTPKIEWRHNGTKINLRNPPPNKELRLTESGFKTDYGLYINNMEDSDFGNYTCSAKNSKGRATHKLILTPLPSKVEIVSDIEGNYSSVYDLKWMVVSVVKPSDYRLLIRTVINETMTGEWNETNIMAVPDSGSVHTQTYTIGDLEPETMYEVVLRAYNRYGWGEPSDLFMFQTNEAEDNANAGVKTTAEHSLFLLAFLLPLYLS